ncbi:MAG: hypothetical protein JWO22_4208 [Frankiales bacterium]|nr:hypothetical protein [Frankiales bacterium]
MRRVSGPEAESYLVVTTDHRAAWLAAYQGLPKAETLDVYAI